MLLVKTSLRYSPIHGLGCFAEEDIRKGQMVWKFDPALDLVFDTADLEKYPEGFRDFLKIYSYGQVEESKKLLVLCGDHARHMNHSSTPNLLDASEEYGINVAARDIKAGEELTCDYNAFDADVGLKLSHS